MAFDCYIFLTNKLFKIKINKIYNFLQLFFFNLQMGIGDWGLGIDPIPQSPPIPIPHS